MNIEESNSSYDLSGIVWRDNDIKHDFKGFLGTTIADPQQHVLFLNTLSFMEHLGHKKIIDSSKRRGDNGPDIRRHRIEENGHARFFKTQAERLVGHSIGYDSGEMLIKSQASGYFSNLNKKISRDLQDTGDRKLPYLWVSLAVEWRAKWTYAPYDDALKKAGSPFRLNRLMAQETGHMDEIYRDIKERDREAGKRLPHYAAIEAELFRNVWNGLKEAQPIGLIVGPRSSRAAMSRILEM